MQLKVIANEILLQRSNKVKGVTYSRFSETVWSIRDALGYRYQLTFSKEHEATWDLYDKLDKAYFVPFDEKTCTHPPMIANIWALEFTNIVPKMGTHSIYFQVKNGSIDVLYVVATVGKKGASRILTADRYLYTYDLLLLQIIGSMIAYGYFSNNS